MKDVKAIILGGGRGTRLFPLTLERAKPAVGIAGKYRLIDIPISNCTNSGIRNIFVLTQFLSASLHRHIMQTYRFDKFCGGFVDILAAEQTNLREDWFQGTADAVRATLNHTTYYRSEQMLILSGDHLYRMDYARLVDFHRESGAEITLCVYPVSREEATRMGLIRVDPGGNVRDFVEKPSDPDVLDRFRAPDHLFGAEGRALGDDRYLASMGIYVFEPDVLAESLADPSRTDFGKEVIPHSVGKRRIMAYPFTGYWMDIGTIAAFYEANVSLARESPPFRLYEPGWPIHTRTRSLPPTRIFHSEIRDSLLAEGSDILGATIGDSVIGVRSTVREGTTLDGVVMLGADFYEGEDTTSDRERLGSGVPDLGIGRNCLIERAIIDKNARIGDDVRIRAQSDGTEHQGERYWIREGITIIPKGAVIPSGTEI